MLRSEGLPRSTNSYAVLKRTEPYGLTYSPLMLERMGQQILHSPTTTRIEQKTVKPNPVHSVGTSLSCCTSVVLRKQRSGFYVRRLNYKRNPR